LAAAKRNTTIIEEDDLKESEVIISDIERDMIKVFESIGVVDQRNHVQEIVSTVRFCGFLTPRGLWNKMMNQMTLKEFEEAIRAAVKAHLIEMAVVNGIQGVQIPSSH
jgi:hypothetical protein